MRELSYTGDEQDQREVRVTVVDVKGKPLVVSVDGVSASLTQALIYTGKRIVERELGEPEERVWKIIRRKRKPIILGEKLI